MDRDMKVRMRNVQSFLCGYLGINIGTVTAAIATEHKLPVSRGAYVGGVEPNSPAAKAGLAEGDIITGLNGTEVKSGDVLRNTIAMTRPGTTVDLEVVRSNEGKKVVRAQLGELPDGDRRAPRRRR
jgi:serine protease Do